MIPEFYRPFETSTLMDLVSYGDSDHEGPSAEEWVSHQVEDAPRRSALGRSRSSLRRKRMKWLRLGRRLVARAVRA